MLKKTIRPRTCVLEIPGRRGIHELDSAGKTSTPLDRSCRGTRRVKNFTNVSREGFQLWSRCLILTWYEPVTDWSLVRQLVAGLCLDIADGCEKGTQTIIISSPWLRCSASGPGFSNLKKVFLDESAQHRSCLPTVFIFAL
ncbi:hypothetical protein RvY_05084 [Ramazzottius varieornatus]|uniref:Uncharacterized protein n=1 Tax=Ramazzottius varieornatus TaxID=947166 RepID=A0A1D1UTU1_RAMVA|nr:hypothetical protein RvY_05084 [Ramazzottius varieornatus]